MTKIKSMLIAVGTALTVSMLPLVQAAEGDVKQDTKDIRERNRDRRELNEDKREGNTNINQRRNRAVPFARARTLIY
jgi:hypothetical protein